MQTNLAPRWIFDCFYGWIGQIRLPVELAFESGFEATEIVTVELITDGTSEEPEVHSFIGNDTNEYLELRGGSTQELEDCVAFALDPLRDAGKLQPPSVSAASHGAPAAELECAVCGCEDCQVVSCEDVHLAARDAA